MSRARRVSGATRTPRRISVLATNPVSDGAVQFTAVQNLSQRGQELTIRMAALAKDAKLLPAGCCLLPPATSCLFLLALEIFQY